MEPRVVYLTQMEVPTKKAHGVQILKTCAALTRFGIQVVLVVEKGVLSAAEVERDYGVAPEPSLFSVVEGRRSLATLLSFGGRGTVFYTRSQRWARLAIRTRPLHGVPLIFETHRKAGVFKNDPETGLGEPLERRRRVEWVFQRADGVVCAVEATQKWLKGLGVSSHHLWYGWTHRLSSSGAPLSLAYAGTKDLEVVLEALRLLPWVRLTVYGVPPHLASSLPPPENVEYKGFLPHARLLRELQRHGGFIATNEGIKLADYLSLGGVIFAPDLPSVREILGEGAVYYRFWDASSLASSIGYAVSSARVCRIVSLWARERRKAFSWPEKGEVLLEFIRSFSLR